MAQASRPHFRPVHVPAQHRRGCHANPFAAHPSIQQVLQPCPQPRPPHVHPLYSAPTRADQSPPPPAAQTSESRRPARGLLRGNGTPWSLQCRRAITPAQHIAQKQKRQSQSPLPLAFQRCYARLIYAPSAVSTRIFSPSLMNGGTWTTSPVSSFAGLVTEDAVADLIPGSVSTTVISTTPGSSIPTALPSWKLTLIDKFG